ncbi:MAG: ABC transporter permease [Oscillospiraceae bacterium]
MKKKRSVIRTIKENRFLLEELIKRDFTKKYKRTVLGVFWSVLSPLLTLAIMALVFTHFFGRTVDHFIIYMFCGNLLFRYFKEATGTGMTALTDNAGIISKINVPKYMFLLSKNVSVFIGFLINFVLLFVFCLADHVPITWKFVLLIYPTGCLVIFNLGMGLILSALYLMFKDMKYLYELFTLTLSYVSAIFYPVSTFPADIQQLFLLNPVYVYIKYYRMIILEGVIPPLSLHLLALGYGVLVMLIGGFIYKKYNYKFLYYI